MWRPVVMTLVGLAGCGLLVLLAWLELEVDDGSARQAEREQQRSPRPGGGAGRSARRAPGTSPDARHAARRRLG